MLLKSKFLIMFSIVNNFWNCVMCSGPFPAEQQIKTKKRVSNDNYIISVILLITPILPLNTESDLAIIGSKSKSVVSSISFNLDSSRPSNSFRQSVSQPVS